MDASKSQASNKLSKLKRTIRKFTLLKWSICSNFYLLYTEQKCIELYLFCILFAIVFILSVMKCAANFAWHKIIETPNLTLVQMATHISSRWFEWRKKNQAEHLIGEHCSSIRYLNLIEVWKQTHFSAYETQKIYRCEAFKAAI